MPPPPDDQDDHAAARASDCRGLLRAVGWDGWAQVLAWCEEHDASWGDLATHLGVDRVLTRSQREHILAVTAWVEAHGNVRAIEPIALRSWLSGQRARVRAGEYRFVHMALDFHAPRWRETGHTKSIAACLVPGCEARQASMRLCPQHRHTDLGREAFWQTAYADLGWDSLVDALAWAEEREVGWSEVAKHAGIPKKELALRAAFEGVRTPGRLTPRQQRMLEFIEIRRATRYQQGVLSPAENAALGSFLQAQRKLRAKGTRTRVLDRLDQIDPDWHLPLDQRPNSTPDGHTAGIVEEESGEALRGFVERTVACRECGQRFERLAQHLRAHQMTTAHYTAAHPQAELKRPAHRDLPAAYLASVERKREEAKLRWTFLLAEQGWDSWPHAAAWARRTGHSAGEVADLLGVPREALWREIADEGVTFPRGLKATERRMIEIARETFAEHGTVLEGPEHFHDWLNGLRHRRKIGRRSPAAYVMDDIDPGWDAPLPMHHGRIPGRSAAEQARWDEGLARNGWDSLADALAWAEENNTNWHGVAARMGLSYNAVRAQANTEGLGTPKRFTQREERLFDLLQQRTEADNPFRCLPREDGAELSGFLAHQRKRLAQGKRTRLHDRLDQIDPDWEIPLKKRPKGTCVLADCDQPALGSGFCQRHHHQRYATRRWARRQDADLIACRECGRELQRLADHLRTQHRLTAEEYQAKHPGAPLAATVLSARMAQGQRAASEARKTNTATTWARRLAAQGWNSWDDAVAWARTNGVGLTAVRERLDVTEGQIRRAIREAGVAFPRPITDAQRRLLDLARTWHAHTGTLANPEPDELRIWLNTMRYAHARGAPSLAGELLTTIDPTWPTTAGGPIRH